MQTTLVCVPDLNYQYGHIYSLCNEPLLNVSGERIVVLRPLLLSLSLSCYSMYIEVAGVQDI